MPTVKTGGKVLDQSNAAVEASYVYLALTSHQFKAWSLEWVVTNTTITLEFTNERPEVDINLASAAELAALHWKDLTEARTGAATQTTSGTHTQDQKESWYLMRVKVLPTNATNACALYFNGTN